MRKIVVILVSAVLFGLANPGLAETPAGASGQAVADLSKIAGWKGAAPNSPDTFRFVVLSDRTGGHVPGLWAKAVAETNRLKPDFVITIGDLIEGYIDDEKEIRRQWKEFDAMTRKLDAPFFYCPGNHDVMPDACRKIYTELHGVAGKAWYSFDFRGCHFLVADSSAMIGMDKKLAADHWAWLEKDLARAKEADHVFVFLHHPTLSGHNWKRLRAMLDPKKATVFSGHWHSPVCYDLVDGVPYLVLSATAAGAGGAPKGLNRVRGRFQCYAHVVVAGGKPTISIIPLGEVLPRDFVDRSVVMRPGRIAGAAALSSTTRAGGEVMLNLPNPTDADVSCTLIWTGEEGWFVGGLPKAETLPLAAGKTIKRTYRIRQVGAEPAPPVLALSYKITAEGRTIQHGRKLALPVLASLNASRVRGITIDGKLNDWAEVPARATKTRRQVRYFPKAWSGPDDCSFQTRIGCDERCLYLAVDVTDDAIVTDGVHKWHRDGLMVSWDPRLSGQRDGKFTGPPRKVIITVPAGAEKPPIYVLPEDPAIASAVRTAYRRREGGYVFELAIPFSAMGGGPKLVAGQAIGLKVVVHDKDKTSSSVIIKGMVMSVGPSASDYVVVTFR